MNERVHVARIHLHAIFVIELIAVSVLQIIDDSERVRNEPLSETDGIAHRIHVKVTERPRLGNLSIPVVAGEDKEAAVLQRPMDLGQNGEPVLMADCIDAGLAEQDEVEAVIRKRRQIACIQHPQVRFREAAAAPLDHLRRVINADIVRTELEKEARCPAAADAEIEDPLALRSAPKRLKISTSGGESFAFLA